MKRKDKNCVDAAGVGKLETRAMDAVFKARDAAEKAKGSPLTHAEIAKISNEILTDEFREVYSNQAYAKDKSDVIDNLTVYLTETFEKAPDKGMDTILYGSDYSVSGTARSIGDDIKIASDRVIFNQDKMIFEEDLTDVLTNRGFSKDLTLAMVKKQRGEAVDGMNPRVARAAEILNSIVNEQEIAALSRGITTRSDRSRLSPGVLSPSAISQSGNKGSREAILKDFKQTLKETEVDLEKLFPEVTDGNYDLSTSKLFQELGDGRGNTYDGAKEFVNEGIPFKTAEGQAKFIEKYGFSPLAGERNLQRARSLQRNIVLHDRTGGGGVRTLDSVVKKSIKALTEKGKTAEASSLDNYWRGMRDRFWNYITGQSSRDVAPKRTGVFSFLSTFASGIDLGMSSISTIGDVHNAGAARVLSTGGGFGRGMASSLGSLVNAFGNKIFTGVTKADRRLAHKLGVTLQKMQNDPQLRFTADAGEIGGRAGAFRRMIYKSTLMPRLTDAQKLKIVANWSADLYNSRGLDYDKLPIQTQRHFRRSNISKGDWDVIRQHAIGDFESFKFISPEEITGIPDHVIPKELLGKRTPHQYKIQLRRRMMSAQNETMLHSLFEANAGSDVKFARKDMQQGSWARILWTDMISYMTWPLQRLARGTKRMLVQHRDDVPSMGQALKDTFAKGGILTNPQQRTNAMMQLAGGLQYGALILWLRDIAKGRTPHVPENEEQWRMFILKSLVAGGVGGIVLDLLIKDPMYMGESFGYGKLGSRVLDFFKAMHKGTIKGDGRGFAMSLYNVALESSPVGILDRNIVTSAAFNQLINDQVKDQIKPGYTREKKKTLRKKKGQEQFLNP